MIKDSTDLPKNFKNRRSLDYYVIENIHKIVKETGLNDFDSVRSVFFEGNESYPDLYKKP
jgi:hypothetical protein